MKRNVLLATLFASLATLSATQAFARDTVANYPVAPALQSEPGKVSDDIALYFAGQPQPTRRPTLSGRATWQRASMCSFQP
jgi:hypothetical protein